MPILVDSRRSQPHQDADLARQAEALIRSLEGVTHARVESGGDGIRAIHVTARDDDAAHRMARHVRSALLAGLATPVLPDLIHVRVAEIAGGVPGGALGIEEPEEPRETGRAAPPRDRIRLLHDDLDHDAARAAADAAAITAATMGPRHDDDTVGPTARPRLVAVDIDRPGDGRVVCRVAVAYDAAVHRAEAAAVDLPGAAAQAAAQAAVRALMDAGMHGLELAGLREVEIAGREYVVVALRIANGSVRHRSGSAPVIGSAERSAAEAAVLAARDMV